MIKAKYTVVLKTIMEDEHTKPLLNKALSTYPMYTPINSNIYSHIPTREELNKKILNHYKYREIGFETVGRFLDELEISMCELMPYYVQMYKSADIMNGIEDPFGNVDITEKFEQETTGTASGTAKEKITGSSSSESNSEASSSSNSSNTSNTSTELHNNDKNVKSATPQGLLNIGTTDINSVNHANEANWNEALSNSSGTSTDTGESTNTTETTGTASASNESETEGQSSSSTSGTTSHTFTKKGNQGVNTYAHDMKELREIFLNIEQMIINDERLSELFLRIY